MTTEKIERYTAEQTVTMLASYFPLGTESERTAQVANLALLFGKSVRSIIAKLAKEHVYVGKDKVAGKREMLKAEMVAEIAELMGKTDEQMESLEKATGPALMAVLSALRTSVKE